MNTTILLDGQGIAKHFASTGEGTESDPIVLGGDRITFDAWGDKIVSHKFSIFDSLFQIDIPNQKWEEALIIGVAGNYYDHADHIHQISTGQLENTGVPYGARSVGGGLELSSGTIKEQGVLLNTKRSPQYQPDRGHALATSIIVPFPIRKGFGEFGWLGHDNDVFIRFTGNGTTVKVEYVLIKDNVITKEVDITANLPSGVDLSKGHLWDLKLQIRNVGDHFIFFDRKLVYKDSNVGLESDFVLSNPSMPLGYRAVNLDLVGGVDTEYIIKSGCINLTAEGGQEPNTEPVFSTTGDWLSTISGVDTAMIILRIPRHITYNGNEIHTARDVVISLINAVCKDEYKVTISVGRDTQLIDKVTDTGLMGVTAPWIDKPNSVLQEMIVGDSNIDAQARFVADRVNLNQVYVTAQNVYAPIDIQNQTGDKAPYRLTAGDVLVVSIESIAGADDALVSIQMTEEI